MSSSLTRRHAANPSPLIIFLFLMTCGKTSKASQLSSLGRKGETFCIVSSRPHSAVIQASCIINLFSIKSLNFLAMLSFMIDSVGHFMIPNVFFSFQRQRCRTCLFRCPFSHVALFCLCPFCRTLCSTRQKVILVECCEIQFIKQF